MRPASPSSAAGSRRVTPIRSRRRSAAATTSWTGRCGWTTCTCRGNACSWSIPSPELIARWLFWHQLYCWLSKAEFTLGLALACSHAMGLTSHDATINYLLDLMTDVQTVRSCQVAAERDPQFTAGGLLLSQSVPSRGRQHRDAEGASAHERDAAHRARLVAGRGADGSPTSPRREVAAGLEESFSGGGYSALQRSALLQMAWDHVSSALDGRESAFELHANGGVPAWRGRLRRGFEDYNKLANGVLRQLSVAMPEIDLSGIRNAPMAPRRVVEVPPAEPIDNHPEETAMTELLAEDPGRADARRNIDADRCAEPARPAQHVHAGRLAGAHDIPRMVGIAFTMRFIPSREDKDGPNARGPRSQIQPQAMETCPPGHVLVVDSRGDARAASAGDLYVGRLKARGCAGIVTDGGLRDSEGIFKTGLPAYHRRAVVAAKPDRASSVRSQSADRLRRRGGVSGRHHRWRLRWRGGHSAGHRR